jgi:hypothetical protein
VNKDVGCKTLEIVNEKDISQIVENFALNYDINSPLKKIKLKKKIKELIKKSKDR